MAHDFRQTPGTGTSYMVMEISIRRAMIISLYVHSFTYKVRCYELR